MGNIHLKVLILESASDYISTLKETEQGVAKANIEAMASGDFMFVQTKQLKDKVRELKFGDHRITYFQLGDHLYFIRGFKKKSTKTPKKEIEYAEKVYRILTKNKK